METKITDQIYWIGVFDWLCRDFHGYAVRRGVSYNSYLVCGSAGTAIIDGVKAPFVGEQLEHLARHGVSADSVSYVVVNHAELDHSSGLPALLAACHGATVVCDAKCEKTLRCYFDDACDWRFRIVREGESLSLGDVTLSFVETPMAHWPESMMTYVPERGVLFSMDAFGQHYPSYSLFDDLVPFGDVMHELRHYYANILQPLGRTTGAAVKKALPLRLSCICPSHGVVWRKYISEVVEAYQKWSGGVTDQKVVVCYDSMWGSTEAMARAVADGASQVAGTRVCLFHIRHVLMSDIMDELLEAGGLAFGSPTQNTMYLPEVGALLTDIQGLRPALRAGLVFGSCGWVATGAERLQTALRSLGLEMVSEKPVCCQWKPSADVLAACREAGRSLSLKVKGDGVE
ncbi:FprA family A-type flavoprotein [Candidatus Sumerlaeota bacterium]|nr:FprA family A-type flavoprotein [Candidatus Sumerlaeales bacterium]NLD62220.1 FprA family A-type flavoprotein [Candidatus Sumerlaeota bacterium]